MLDNITITFDWSWIDKLGTMPLYELLWSIFINGGWIIISLVIIWGLFLVFVKSRQDKFTAKQSYVFLAIDIPKINLQSPKAVENIFSTLAGAHMPLEWEEKIFEGQYQLGFSMEIVCIDGFIQYVIRTPVHWRDLVEAAFYSQYPDAEITEVEDYTVNLEVTFPSDEYNIWGADLKLIRDDYFPIRSYAEFEHPLSKDIKDPLAALLETMNKMRPGEQFWFQILVYPTDVSWRARGEKALAKMIGKKMAEKKTILDAITDAPLNFLGAVSEQLLGSPPAEEKKDDRSVSFLPPMEHKQAEGITFKLSKIGFECKARIVYFGKREVFNKGLGVSGTFGAIKQFTDMSLNGFKPDKNKTTVRFPFFKQRRLSRRQNNIFRAYKKRDAQTGSAKYILNIEELATIYHFPYIETYSPTIKRIESKKAMAPTSLPSTDIGLPVEEISAGAIGMDIEVEKEGKQPVIDYDDDYFEKRFAKDKTGKIDKQRKKQIVEKIKSGEIKAPKPVEKKIEPRQAAQKDDLDFKFAKNLTEVKKAEEKKEEIVSPSVEKNEFEKEDRDIESPGTPPENLPFA